MWRDATPSTESITRRATASPTILNVWMSASLSGMLQKALRSGQEYTSPNIETRLGVTRSLIVGDAEQVLEHATANPVLYSTLCVYAHSDPDLVVD